MHFVVAHVGANPLNVCLTRLTEPNTVEVNKMEPMHHKKRKQIEPRQRNGSHGTHRREQKTQIEKIQRRSQIHVVKEAKTKENKKKQHRLCWVHQRERCRRAAMEQPTSTTRSRASCQDATEEKRPGGHNSQDGPKDPYPQSLEATVPHTEMGEAIGTKLPTKSVEGEAA